MRLATLLRGIALGLCTILCAASLSADVLYLRNGKRVYGKILTQNQNSVLIKTSKGNVTVPKRLIRRLTYSTFEESQQAERERQRRLAEIRRQRAEEARRREAERRRKAAEEAFRRARLQAIAARKAYRTQEAQARAARAAYLRDLIKRGRLKKGDVDEPVGYWDFAWRSLLVPGWGHYRMKKPLIATAYAAGFLYMVAQTIRFRSAAVAAQKANADEVSTNTLLFTQFGALNQAAIYYLGVESNRRYLNDYQAKIDRYHASLGGLAVLYALQLAHIIYNGFAWEKGQVVHGPNTPTEVGVQFTADFYAERTGPFTSGRRGEVRATFSF